MSEMTHVASPRESPHGFGRLQGAPAEDPDSPGFSGQGAPPHRPPRARIGRGGWRAGVRFASSGPRFGACDSRGFGAEARLRGGRRSAGSAPGAEAEVGRAWAAAAAEEEIGEEAAAAAAVLR